MIARSSSYGALQRVQSLLAFRNTLRCSLPTFKSPTVTPKESASFDPPTERHEVMPSTHYRSSLPAPIQQTAAWIVSIISSMTGAVVAKDSLPMTPLTGMSILVV